MMDVDKATDANTFMTALRRYRLAAGLDQGQLAKAVGVTSSAVSTWESGKFIPKPRLFPKIARVLGIKPIDLTRFIQPETESPSK